MFSIPTSSESFVYESPIIKFSYNSNSWKEINQKEVFSEEDMERVYLNKEIPIDDYFSDLSDNIIDEKEREIEIFTSNQSEDKAKHDNKSTSSKITESTKLSEVKKIQTFERIECDEKYMMSNKGKSLIIT